MNVSGMWTYTVLSAMKMTVFPDGDLYILNKCEAGYQTEGSGVDVAWKIGKAWRSMI